MIQSTLLAELESAFQRAVTAEVESQLTGIKQHFANTIGELTAKVASLEHAIEMKELDYATLAEALTESQLNTIARKVSPHQIIEAIDWSEILDYAEIASCIDVSDVAEELEIADIAGEFNLSEIASRIDLGDLADEVSIGNLAEEISLANLASEIDGAQLAIELDLDERLRQMLAGRSVTIQL